jgi:hypothetical protein
VNKLVEKWKPIIDYTSDTVKPVFDPHKPELAELLEKAEKWYSKRKNVNDLKFAIPEIRRNYLDLDWVENERWKYYSSDELKEELEDE